jgi:FkbM family methyltransferase
MEFLIVNHIPAKKAEAHSSHIEVKVESGMSEILDPLEFPLKISLKRILGDEIWYECDLYPGMWMGHKWFEGCYVDIQTRTGKRLWKESWHPLTHGTTSDVMFYLWTLQNPMNCGIVIGSNDGTYGDYLIPFLEKNIGEVTFIEASERIFQKLKEKYRDFYNVKFKNYLVTPVGGKVNFYEHPDNSKDGSHGFANSVYRHMAELVDTNIVEYEKNSISINELILESGYDKNFWLLIDAEGLDGELVEALDFSRISKPQIIVWEKGFGCDNSFASPYLEKNGYKIYDELNENNIIAILKENE